jgi:hypothetical protein
MPPIPSEPASIPIDINKIRTGTPKLNDVLPAKREINKSMEPINNIFSVVSVIYVFFENNIICVKV